MTYNDFSSMLHRQAFVYGRSDGPWGIVQWQPDPDGVHSVAQFLDTALKHTSGEMMSQDGTWVYNTGFRNPDGTVNKISVVREILSDPTGSTDITVVGGPQHYALWNTPDYEYDIFTEADIVMPSGAKVRFSHSQVRSPAAYVTNPFWLGRGSQNQLAIKHHEVWSDDSDGTWKIRKQDTSYLAKNYGSMWYTLDELSGVDFGQIIGWSYV